MVLPSVVRLRHTMEPRDDILATREYKYTLDLSRWINSFCSLSGHALVCKALSEHCLPKCFTCNSLVKRMPQKCVCVNLREIHNDRWITRAWIIMFWRNMNAFPESASRECSNFTNLTIDAEKYFYGILILNTKSRSQTLLPGHRHGNTYYEWSHCVSWLYRVNW